MKENNDPGKLMLKIEGKDIEEKSSGKLLGLIWSSNMDWQDHPNDVVERFNEKSRGIMKVSCWLSFKRRKELVESSLVFFAMALN